MYVAGMEPILLLWGAIVALALLTQYAVITLAPAFVADNPWFPAPVWGVLTVAGMVGSSVLGHRASKANASGPAARSAGIRVFLYWLAVVSAAFLVPAGAGLWTAGIAAVAIARVAVGIVALGYILFGIMHRPVLVAVGLGFATPFYLSSHFAGDAAMVISAVATLVVVALAWVWIRRSGAS